MLRQSVKRERNLTEYVWHYGTWEPKFNAGQTI